jgi:endonuclease G
MDEYVVEVPLRVTITLGPRGRPTPPVVDAAAGEEPGLERVDVDRNYANRQGYDPEFLGTRVLLPQLTDEQRRNAARNSMTRPGEDNSVLPYHHFSVVMNRRRQLAYYTAVNIDGTRSRSPKRSGDQWYFDPRIAQSEQIGEDLYRRNDLDRGHLVRRLDPAWGTAKEALSANNDTFHFTNCSPQHANFNQSNDTWQGVENYLLQQATQARRRLTIFTGPVLGEDDPLYRGVRLPLFFWKIAVFIKRDESVSVSAYVLDQTELIEQEIGLERFNASSFQVEVREIIERTGLDFSHLVADEGPLERAPGLERDRGFARKPLASVSDIVV